MIIYEVTAVVEARLAETYERYMRQQHIQDVLATGCFQSAALASDAPGRYRMRYEASTDEDLERLGVVLSREVWTVIQRWDA